MRNPNLTTKRAASRTGRLCKLAGCVLATLGILSSASPVDAKGGPKRWECDEEQRAKASQQIEATLSQAPVFDGCYCKGMCKTPAEKQIWYEPMRLDHEELDASLRLEAVRTSTDASSVSPATFAETIRAVRASKAASPLLGDARLECSGTLVGAQWRLKCGTEGFFTKKKRAKVPGSSTEIVSDGGNGRAVSFESKAGQPLEIEHRQGLAREVAASLAISGLSYAPLPQRIATAFPEVWTNGDHFWDSESGLSCCHDVRLPLRLMGPEIEGWQRVEALVREAAEPIDGEVWVSRHATYFAVGDRDTVYRWVAFDKSDEKPPQIVEIAPLPKKASPWGCSSAATANAATEPWALWLMLMLGLVGRARLLRRAQYYFRRRPSALG